MRKYDHVAISSATLGFSPRSPVIRHCTLSPSQDPRIEIRATGAEKNSAMIRIWVEVDRPIVHAEIETSEKSTVRATYESWRTEPIELPNTGKNLHRGQCLINFDNHPDPVFVQPEGWSDC